MSAGNTVCRIVSLVLALLSFCLVISSLSTISWLDDQNPTTYEIFMGTQEFEIRGSLYDGTYTYKDNLDLLQIIYGSEKAGDFEDAATAVLAFGILAGICQFVGLICQFANFFLPKLAMAFKAALVSLWLSGFFITIGLVYYVAMVYDNLEGDMGYNSSFAMSACSGIFVAISVACWWIGAPTHDAITWCGSDKE